MRTIRNSAQVKHEDAVKETADNVLHFKSKGKNSTDMESVCDWPALRKRYKERDAFINRLGTTILKSQATTAEELRQAVKNNDLKQVHYLAHSLKGVGGNLEAKTLQAQALQTENYAKENHPELEAAVSQLAAIFDKLMAELAAKTS